MNAQTMTTAEKALFIRDSIAEHGGKMAGIPSISTSALENKGCTARRAINDAVCADCYACKYLNYRKTLREKCGRNHAFYTTADIKPEDVPRINACMFRFESFGELENVQQFQNYCTIAAVNKNTTFSIWTKQPNIIQEYTDNGGEIPNNLNIILSSRFINVSDAEYYRKKYWTINYDAVFTVYTKEHAEKHNIPIQCGGNSCIDCGLCYSRFDHDDEPIEINELLK